MKKKTISLLPRLVLACGLYVSGALVPSSLPVAQAQEANQWEAWASVGGSNDLEYRYKPSGKPTDRGQIANIEFRGSTKTHKITIISTNLRNDGTLNPNHHTQLSTVYMNSNGTGKAMASYPVVVEVSLR